MIFNFTAKKREGKAEDVRAEDLLPGVLYGPEIEPVSLEVDYNTFAKLHKQAGESSLIDFTLEGGKEAVKVLIQDIQYDPVKGKMIHFDLRQIEMGKEMTATIVLSFVGESMAVKEQGGTLMETVKTVNVRCLPKDLVSEIEVDLSVLNTFDDMINIGDLKLPAGIVVTDDPETMIAKVNAPLTEEQIKAMEEAEAPSVEDVEVEGEGEEDKEGEGEEDKEGEADKEKEVEEKKADADDKKEEKKKKE